MLTKRIIPCLDVTEGRVVKGTNFVGLRDAGDPVELAKRYDDEGADELVFLDITASSDKRKILLDVVEKTAQCVHIPLTVGGGINDIATIKTILNAGADKVSLNSAAIKNPGLIAEASKQFGAQCVVVAIDAKRTENGWDVFTHGGRNNTGLEAVAWAENVCKLGAGELLVTSMDRDGTKSGYDIALLSAIAKRVSVPVIASGGAGTLGHIADALQVCDAALLASLLHFRELTVEDIKVFCRDQQLPIRL